ncbi:19865_t:CDS:2 [Racocetra persica]|uniref:19865_t:CDS:1 n=1 Tax=Racocetra persica TaxID=160502 RepID=A0ACA9N044_9GLOM|nr:19865_t:CDS:2 [Racocetra persica]
MAQRNQVPSLKELCYTTLLELDIKQSNSNDFGLLQATEDPLFMEELLNFASVKQVSFSNEELALQRKNKRNLNERDNEKQGNEKQATFGEIEANMLFKDLFNK